MSSGEQGPNIGPEHERQHNFAAGMTGNSPMFQTICGAAAVILAILGLAGLHPVYMAAVATIAVATAMALQGIAVGSCYSSVIGEMTGKHPVADIRTGLTAEFVAGATGIVLGVLSLSGLDVATLTAVAVIVLGSGVLLGAGIAGRVARFAPKSSAQHPFFEKMVGDVVTAAAGAEVLVGGGAIVLGVIALVGTLSLTLTLVALLALGSATVMASTAVAGKIGSIWAHH